MVDITELDVTKWVLFCVGARRSTLFTHLVLVWRGVNGRRYVKVGEEGMEIKSSRSENGRKRGLIAERTSENVKGRKKELQYM